MARHYRRQSDTIGYRHYKTHNTIIERVEQDGIMGFRAKCSHPCRWKGTWQRYANLSNDEVGTHLAPLGLWHKEVFKPYYRTTFDCAYSLI